MNSKEKLKISKLNWQEIGLEEKYKIMNTYRDIYGSPPWNEGAYCNKEGWGKRISLQEYRERLKINNLHCDCGGYFTPCYPDEEVGRILNEELENKDQKPFGVIIKKGEKVIGFVFAGIIIRKHLINKVVKTRSEGDKKRDTRLLEGLELILEKGKIDKILYCYEIGIKKEERKGITPLSLLIKGLLVYGENNNVFSGLFWTDKKNAIYKIAILAGFLPVYSIPDFRTGERIFFLLNIDFKKILYNLKIFKNPAIALIRTNSTK